MPTICPNCLRPVRPEARYCGYCGSNLNPAARDDSPGVITPTLDSETMKALQSYKPPEKTSAGRVRRTILMVIIILLCLVLLVAFSVYYFQLIR